MGRESERETEREREGFNAPNFNVGFAPSPEGGSKPIIWDLALLHGGEKIDPNHRLGTEAGKMGCPLRGNAETEKSAQASWELFMHWPKMYF
jgi:hypothetical protein